jgi:hypothetical protein
MRGVRNSYKIIVGKPEYKRLFERPSLRWEDDVKVDFK